MAPQGLPSRPAAPQASGPSWTVASLGARSAQARSLRTTLYLSSPQPMVQFARGALTARRQRATSAMGQPRKSTVQLLAALDQVLDEPSLPLGASHGARGPHHKWETVKKQMAVELVQGDRYHGN